MRNQAGGAAKPSLAGIHAGRRHESRSHRTVPRAPLSVRWRIYPGLARPDAAIGAKHALSQNDVHLRLLEHTRIAGRKLQPGLRLQQVQLIAHESQRRIHPIELRVDHVGRGGRAIGIAHTHHAIGLLR